MNEETRSGTKRSGAHLGGLQNQLDPKRPHKSASLQRRPTAHYEVSSFIHFLFLDFSCLTLSIKFVYFLLIVCFLDFSFDEKINASYNAKKIQFRCPTHGRTNFS